MHIPFRPIARLLASTVRPRPSVDVSALQTSLSSLSQDGGGVLITVNHYTAQDFRAWWFVILISAIFPTEIRWVVTSGWTNSGWLDGFTHWLFPLGASILGFTSMPAMPPDPREVEQRASAVRQVLHYARHTSNAVIGLAPEGGDSPGGVLSLLPPGAGRFMYLLNQSCPHILPVGVWKENRTIHLKFGAPYQLEPHENLSPTELDRYAGEAVMQHIADLLPERLRGRYGNSQRSG